VLSNPAVDLGWSSGPGGTPTNANDRAEWERRRAAETAPTDVTSVEFRQPALRYKSAAGGTAGDVTVFADGQGADALPSFLSAEALHQFLADQL
jgi:hypothetical protein